MVWMLVIFLAAIAALPLLVAYRAECWFLTRRFRALSVLLPLALGLALLYGGLRASGLLLYPTDHQIQNFIYDYTYQRSGYPLVFFCGPAFLGAAAAVVRALRPAHHQ